MTLNDWLKANKSPAIRARLADKCGTSVAYLMQLANSNSTKKHASPEMCELLYKGTTSITPKAVITPAEQRPDIAKVFSIKPTRKAA